MLCPPLLESHWTSSNPGAPFQFSISSFLTPLLPVSLTYESQLQDSFLLRPHHTVSTIMKPLNDSSLSFSLKTDSFIAAALAQIGKIPASAASQIYNRCPDLSALVAVVNLL